MQFLKYQYLTQTLSPQSPVEAWVDVAKTAQKEFWDLFEGTHDRSEVKVFIDQFGKHGAQADIRWLLAAAETGMGGGSKELTRDKHIQEVEQLFIEFHVHKLLADEKVLNRYCHAVLWHGGFQRNFFPMSHRIDKALSAEGTDEYWWYAREAIVMIYTTGRVDLLNEIKPDKLKRPFKTWLRWFDENGPFLRTSKNHPGWKLDKGEKEREEIYLPILMGKLPPVQIQHPFPDWDGPQTPPKICFDSVYIPTQRSRNER